MAIVLHPAEPAAQQVLLHRVSWETYTRLLADYQDQSGVRFTYDRGLLEIMVPSFAHETIKDILTLLVNVLAEELDIDIAGAGSTTFRREDMARGFEPDACFYVQHAERVRGKKQIDLAADPPPDLLIEIDITSSSLPRFPVFAAVGVPEVWRFSGERVSIATLEGDQYVERLESLALSKVTSHILSEFVATHTRMKRPAWLRRVREWARQQGAAKRE